MRIDSKIEMRKSGLNPRWEVQVEAIRWLSTNSTHQIWPVTENSDTSPFPSPSQTLYHFSHLAYTPDTRRIGLNDKRIGQSTRELPHANGPDIECPKITRLQEGQTNLPGCKMPKMAQDVQKRCKSVQNAPKSRTFRSLKPNGPDTKWHKWHEMALF